MNADWGKLGQAEKERRLREARVHLGCVCKLALIQHWAGRYFVHEHPTTAKSWQEKSTVNFQKQTGARKLVIDQCMYGQTCVDDHGVLRPVKKPTTFLTNSPAMERYLNTRCDGKHQHTRLEGGHRNRGAQVYSRGLVDALVNGVELQKKWHDEGRIQIGYVYNLERSLENIGPVPPEESHDLLPCPGGDAWDDVTGLPLDPRGVELARKEEIDYYRKMRAYDKVPVEQCWKSTEKGPINVRWVDVDKHTGEGTAKFRSRFAPCQYNNGVDETSFAATPPLESLKSVISHCAAGESGKGDLGM